MRTYSTGSARQGGPGELKLRPRRDQNFRLVLFQGVRCDTRFLPILVNYPDLVLLFENVTEFFFEVGIFFEGGRIGRTGSIFLRSLCDLQLLCWGVVGLGNIVFFAPAQPFKNKNFIHPGGALSPSTFRHRGDPFRWECDKIKEPKKTLFFSVAARCERSIVIFKMIPCPHF